MAILVNGSYDGKKNRPSIDKQIFKLRNPCVGLGGTVKPGEEETNSLSELTND